MTATVPWRRRRERPMRSVMLAAASALLGAGTAYLWDPERGRRRRALARDRLVATARHTTRGAVRLWRRARATISAYRHRIVHLVRAPARRHEPSPDSVTLAQRVESALFRDYHPLKGHINIDAANGTVVLRGQVSRPDQIRALEKAARHVRGVRQVESYLHVPGTPAPNKAPALEGSRQAVSHP
jgi:BON domain